MTEHEPGVFDGIDLAALAGRIGTPFHVYSLSAIDQRIDALREALQGLDAGICYAVKANSQRAILQHISAAGLGADIVSAGELARCLRAGMPAGRIVFSGVGKTEQEMEQALAAGIDRFNLESLAELDMLQAVADRMRRPARASVRVNPDVDARTHAKISTGRAENKFGVEVAQARQWFADAGRWPAVKLDGLHMHIGSQLLDMEPVRRAIGALGALAGELQAAGHALACIDVGGGLGVRYRAGDAAPAASAWAAAIGEGLAGFRGRILLEPGRWLVAEAGRLVSRVIRVKAGAERNFLVLDAGMNDLARPALYEAWHDITPLVPASRPPAQYDVVGPVCESADTFARDRRLPECRAGDLVCIEATGAYGASMASTYNSRPLAAEVLAEDGRYAVIRPRQTLEHMMAGEQPAEHWEKA